MRQRSYVVRRTHGADSEFEFAGGTVQLVAESLDVVWCVYDEDSVTVHLALNSGEEGSTGRFLGSTVWSMSCSRLNKVVDTHRRRRCGEC
jgi:hypothetical protein